MTEHGVPSTAPLTAPSQAPTGTAVLEPERVEQPMEPGDHERFSHYADKDKILEATVMGTPIRALCGKVWVPSRDPSRFPVCPTCQEIYDGLEPGDDGEGDGTDGGSGD